MAEDLKDQGNAAFRRDDFAGAAALYTRALGLDASVAVCWHNRAVCKLRQGDHEGAVADAIEAATRKPDYAKAYSTKGTALLNLARTEEAVAAFRKGCVSGGGERGGAR